MFTIGKWWLLVGGEWDFEYIQSHRYEGVVSQQDDEFYNNFFTQLVDGLFVMVVGYFLLVDYLSGKVVDDCLGWIVEIGVGAFFQAFNDVIVQAFSLGDFCVCPPFVLCLPFGGNRGSQPQVQV